MIMCRPGHRSNRGSVSASLFSCISPYAIDGGKVSHELGEFSSVFALHRGQLAAASVPYAPRPSRHTAPFSVRLRADPETSRPAPAAKGLRRPEFPKD